MSFFLDNVAKILELVDGHLLCLELFAQAFGAVFAKIQALSTLDFALVRSWQGTVGFCKF